MNPWDEFLARIDVDSTEVSLYPGMPAQVQVPCIVMVPNDPWITDSGFQYDTESYLVICLTEAAASEDALGKLHVMAHAVRAAGGDGWDIDDVGGIRSASIPNDGTAYLGTWIQVTFRNCEHTVEEGS